MAQSILAPCLALAAWMTLAVPASAQGKEPVLASLKDLVSAEVRSQGFHLTQPMKVHVYARGGAAGTDHQDGGRVSLYAYGWILDSSTRRVVWQMTPATSSAQDRYRIADQYLDLPAGSYEAYFANYGIIHRTFFSSWDQNIDRRPDSGREDGAPTWVQALVLGGHTIREVWEDRVPHFGMEVYAADPAAPVVATFPPPLRWGGEVLSLTRTGDGTLQAQGFRLSRPSELHVYALGEGVKGKRLHDLGWIVDARTRKRVWEMHPDKCAYAGGATKNLSVMERITLPAGEYIAYHATDDSHSPADWNGNPPCDPLMYGLTLAIPEGGLREAFSLTEAATQEGKILAQLVKVGNHKVLEAEFTLTAAVQVRVLALGERQSERWYDHGWIEDAATGKEVWTMESADSTPAGGAAKNRRVDAIIQLPKGRYTLHYRTDDSHAYERWNGAPPFEADRYGITLYVQP